VREAAMHHLLLVTLSMPEADEKATAAEDWGSGKLIDAADEALESTVLSVLEVQP
jgi:hypothetical protein